jgi:hypothetical protein
MADEIWKWLIDHLTQRADYFRLFDRYRLRPEPWLKVEVLRALSDARGAGGVSDIRPDRQGCDAWFKAGSRDVWLGIRAVITSYAGAGPNARPTIASVAEVTRDMEKLTALATLGGGTPALLLVAYPFGPAPRERSEWDAQMMRFEAKGFEPTRQHTIPIGTEREAQIYLFIRAANPFG